MCNAHGRRKGTRTGGECYQVILVHQIIELGGSEGVISPVVKIRKEENLANPVIPVDCPRTRATGYALEQENTSRHLNPTLGYRFADVEKGLDDMLYDGIVAYTDVAGCE